MRDLFERNGIAAQPLLPIEVRQLSFAATAGEPLIDGIDLTLNRSGLSVIMGPNGAGKSLLLRLLHGLLEPTSGSISYAGDALNDEIRKRQALVFQRPVLLRRSVAGNLDFAIKLRGRHSASRRDELLHQVGLLSKARQPARLLSGGEQQRLALARALAMEPEILFLDEPTASLDPASTLMIEQITREAHNAGIKVVFVTHDIGQARRLADEVLFLEGGGVIEFQPADAFFAAPKSEAAKGYLEGRLNWQDHAG